MYIILYCGNSYQVDYYSRFLAVLAIRVAVH